MNPRRILMANAILTYGFRPPGPIEDEAAYLAALIEFVMERDFAAAHELRCGRPQAEWTGADVTAFEASVNARRRPPRQSFPPGLHLLPVLREQLDAPATAETLIELATRALARVMVLRQQKPTESMPIFVSVLLTTGALLSTVLFERGNRIATLKWFAQTEPVFGFFLISDAFMHSVVPGTSAGKKDCIIEHIGTRDLRLMKHRTYRVEGPRVIFDDPPPADIDFRNTAGRFEDPYAEIFVSVPASTGRPS
jgi:hypothetical protein